LSQTALDSRTGDTYYDMQSICATVVFLLLIGDA
jgi:hypothetical protein